MEKDEELSTGYLAGSFDLLNVRDLDLIGQAADSCDRLLVGVFTDAHAEFVHGRPPVVPLGERLALVSHVRGVTEVLVHDEQAATPVGAVRFAGQGEERAVGDGVVVLVPRRVTASAALWEAVRPVRDTVGRAEDVA